MTSNKHIGQKGRRQIEKKGGEPGSNETKHGVIRRMKKQLRELRVEMKAGGDKMRGL